MDLLTGSFLGNEARTWLVAVGITVVSFVVIRFVALWSAKRLTALAGRTQVYWDDVVASGLEATKSVLILLVALFLGSNALILPDRSVGILQSVAVIALLVQGGLWLSAGLTTWLVARTRAELEEDPAEAMTLNLIGIGLRLVIWAMVVLLALDNLGIDVTALVAGLGIGGVAVALAAQNILGDLFASLSIALDKPFVLGDFVIVGDFMGSVEAIGIKTTRVRSLSGEQVVFSNTDLLDSRIRNYGRMYERRVVQTLGVTYQTPREELARIPDVIRDAIEGLGGDDVRIDRSHLSNYGDSAIEFEAVYFVLSPEYALHMDIKQRVLLKIHEVFEERGIEFAYPTRTVFVEQSE
jgi:small-conductance mechanosensitive channel